MTAHEFKPNHAGTFSVCASFTAKPLSLTVVELALYVNGTRTTTLGRAEEGVSTSGCMTMNLSAGDVLAVEVMQFGSDVPNVTTDLITDWFKIEEIR